MADLSPNQFANLLKRSNVIDPKKLSEWLQQNGQLGSARKMAKGLVEAGKLTTWQAKFLLSGRHRLRIGNYHLLTRMRRDEFGARYLAVHASLARKVELQIFSKDLTGDTERWQKMIRKATQVATLDHPGLVHVYDIDHDDERYYLVTEHVPGRNLDVASEVFTTQQIGSLIYSCLQSIGVAHQHGVVHGTIGQHDILLTDKGTVKIQNLTISPLRDLNQSSAAPRPHDDYEALARLGQKLLDSNPGSSTGIGQLLSEILQTLADQGAQAIEQLQAWVEKNPVASRGSHATTTSGAIPILSGGHPRPSQRLAGSNITADADPANLYDAHSLTTSASLIHAAKGNLAFLIACGIGLMLLGGIVVFGLMRVINKLNSPIGQSSPPTVAAIDNEAAPAQARAENTDTKTETRSNQWPTEPPTPDDLPVISTGFDSQVTEKTSDEVLDEILAIVDATEPPANPSEATSPVTTATSIPPTPIDSEVAPKYADLLGIRNPGVGNSQRQSSNDSGTTGSSTKRDGAAAKSSDDPVIIPKTEKETPDKLSKIKGIGPATEKALKSAGVKTYKQLSSMRAAHVRQVLRNAKINKSEPSCQDWIDEAQLFAISRSGDPNSIDPGNHFARLPDTLPLPPTDSSAASELAELKIPGIYELTIEAICPPGVSPRRAYFSLHRQETESQTWQLGVHRKPTSDKWNPIAELKYEDSRLSFAWLPTAISEKNATYFRNCFLRLSTPDARSKIVSLREPIKTRSLRITGHQMVDRLNLNIDALPAPATLRIDLLSIPKGEPKIELVQSTVAGDTQAIIGLKEDEKIGDRFLSLQVSAKLKSKSFQLTSGLVVDQNGGQLIESAEQLLLISNQLAANRAHWEARLARKPSDRAISKQKTAAKRKDERMKDYLASINRIVTGGGGRGIPMDFEVVAEFESGRVVLVRSSKNFVEDENKNKK